MEQKVKEILAQMTLEEKISVCNGEDFWHSKAMEEHGLPSFMMSDGPHGLRVQKGEADMLGVNKSEPATCFPAAITSGASWDESLLYAEGRAIGEEGLALGADVVLGPGVNIKRDPRCGRNFEYFSEDPLLSGRLGTSWVQGAQSTGIGTSLKHFAANNQEYKRFNGNSQVDERTLREIYLPAFEKVVKDGQPATVMCAYPCLNGVHCSDNKMLLQDILRDEWGFEGLVVTDWGALCDRVKAMDAGCDLTMPGGSRYMEDRVAKAVRAGQLPEEAVDACAGRVIQFALYAAGLQKDHPFDIEAHDALAQQIAEAGAVLLKNEEDILPLDAGDMVLIGCMAEQMRYQGSGSSHIQPTRLTSLQEALPGVPYAKGCDGKGEVTEESLRAATEAAKRAKIAVVCAGLPDLYESEGFDREDLKMPEGHVRMIEAVAKANPQTVVVLFSGSVVELPWIGLAKAVLYMGLPGQAGGRAAANLLTGAVNPSGKLTETWPLRLEDVPTWENFAHKYVHYSEGLYVGYRYYGKANVPVRFPFGYGLCYTRFEYLDMKVEGNKVTATIQNSGSVPGAEVAQLYVAAPQDSLYRPVRELKGFAKVFLNPGEAKEVAFALDERCFAVWQDGWRVPEGTYVLEIGASSVDIRLRLPLPVKGERIAAPSWQKDSWYQQPSGRPSDRDFMLLFGGAIQEEPKIAPGTFTMEMSMMEMKDCSPVMEGMYQNAVQTIAQSFGGVADFDDPSFRMMVMAGTDSPLRAVVLSSGGSFSAEMAEGLLAMANGLVMPPEPVQAGEDDAAEGAEADREKGGHLS